MACAHEHDGDGDDADVELGLRYSLYQKVDMENVECLNEADEGAAKKLFRPYDERLQRAEYLESDMDEELLISVPFTGMVRLKGIVLVGGESGSHPKTMRLYKDRPGMTFDDCQTCPAQVFDVTRDDQGVVEYAVKPVKFGSIHHLTIHIPDNHGAEVTRLYYIGLRGEFMGEFRDQVVIATYESRAVPQDHKSSLHDAVNHQIK